MEKDKLIEKWCNYQIAIENDGKEALVILKQQTPIDYNNVGETLDKMSDVVSNILLAKRLIDVAESNIKMINGHFPDLKQNQEEDIKKYNQMIAKLEARYKQLRNRL